MSCPSCRSEAPPGAAFCPRCGSGLPAACPVCGHEVAADFAFCPRCGARLGASVPVSPPPAPAAEARRPAPAAAPRVDEADRRPATVLFADVAGFTALAERLDAEEVRAFQTDLFRELAAVIERYDGFVEKFVGDAIMAVFGAPTAHEDDPERALRAALLMHERMADLSRTWERRAGRALTLHVGVNTGPVVAGTLGDQKAGAYAVTGDTVNTAARLQTAAGPGETLVGRATHRLAQHAFAFEPVGELPLKGKVEPLQAFRLVRALDTPRPARGLEAYGLSAALVGRDEQLGQMLAAAERMLTGRAEVISLVGDAGVGKSRLAREFLARLEAAGRLEGMTVRHAACSSLGERTYGVLSTFFREGYGLAPEDSLETARGKLAVGLEALGADQEERSYVAALLGYVLGLSATEPARHTDPEQVKRQIFLAMRAILERRLLQGPVLLVVEDLHWADAASVELLRFMVDRLADRRLMLLFTYRPDFDARAIVTSRATHTAIRLTPLSADDSAALLDAFFGPSARRLPARLRELIVGRAEGNPFYLEEVVRGLIGEGVLVREGGEWSCGENCGDVDVPATVQGLLLSRLDRLPAPARRLAQEAAVLGPVFGARLLRLVASEPATLEAALEVLQDAGLVEEASAGSSVADGAAADGSRYRFAHALVQETIYQNLLVRRRAVLHDLAGQALETLCECGEAPRRLQDLEALGYHFGLGSDRLKGARYLAQAGDWARAVYANDDALRHYERALRTLAECGVCEADAVGVRERLGDVLGLVGRRDEALAHYDAVRAAAATGDRPGEARVYRKMAGLRWDGGDRARALESLRAGLGLLEGTEHIELAYLYQEMGRLAFRSGDNTRAIEWAERALAQAERVAARAESPAADGEEARKEAAAAISHAHNTRGVALARLDRLADAVAEIEKSVEVARAHDLLQVACRGYANLGVLYSTLDPSRAIDTSRRGLEIAKRIGDLGFQSRLYANLAVAYCALTNRCDADGVAAAQAAIDLDRQLGQLDHLAVPLIVLAQIYQCHGEPERALAHYREALGLAEQAGEPQLLFPCYDGLATLYLDRGDHAQAEQYMQAAQRVCEQAGIEPDSLMVLPFLS